MSESVYKPVVGWGNGGELPRKPALTPDGLKPVAMLSPCPYTNFELYDTTLSMSAQYSTNGKALRVTLTDEADIILGTFKLRMIYEGVPRYNVVVTRSTAAAVTRARFFLLPYATKPYTFFDTEEAYWFGYDSEDGTREASISAPYYRWHYTGTVEFQAPALDPLQPGDWIQFELTPAT